MRPRNPVRPTSILRLRATRACRLLIVALLSAGMLALSPGVRFAAFAQGEVSTAEAEVLAAEYEELVARLDEVRASLDRSAFDPEGLAFELAFADVDQITDWVRTEIAFEQYPGLLRGAEGTTMARAGNALDQAVLLATLLGDAGYDARIASGRLDEARARVLVRSMIAPRRPLPSPSAETWGELQRIVEDANAWRQRLPGPVPARAADGAPVPDALFDLREVSLASSQRLRGLLDERGAAIGTLDEATLVEEARTYHWVQAREPGGDWRDLHPAFAAEDAPRALVAGDTFEGSVPTSLLHRLRIDVVLEQKVGDRLESHTLLDGWTRPAANLVGRPLEIAFVPFGVATVGELADALAGLEDANPLFVPTFQGSVMSDLLFDTKGRRVPIDAASNAAAGVFKEVGDAFGDANDALGGMDGDEDAPGALELTALWVDYSLVGPGGASRTHRRYVLDRLGPDARAAGDLDALDPDPSVFVRLAHVQRVLVAPGPLADGAALDAYGLAWARAVETQRDLLELIADYRPEARLPADASFEPVALAPLALTRLLDAGPAPAEGSIVYRSEPSLVVVEDALSYADGSVSARAATDIVNNARRGFRLEGEALVPSPELPLRLGAWDTWAERAFLQRRHGDSEGHGAADVLAAASDGPWTLLRSGDAREAGALGLAGHAREAVQRDLEAGYLLVVPGGEGSRPDAWWRVDPGTGQSLGMTSDGQGASTLEYLALGAAIAILGLLVVLHVEQKRCQQALQDHPYLDDTTDPRLERDYERQSLGCSHNWLMRQAVFVIDEEVQVHDDKCDNDPVWGTLSPSCGN